MAKAKTKAAGTNLPVPQNDADAEQLIARLGALQCDLATDQATHDALVAEIEGKHGEKVKASKEAQTAIIDGLAIWASANRERLTKGGRTKTVQLPTGTILWREGRFAVKHRPLKVEDVVSEVQKRIAAIESGELIVGDPASTQEQLVTLRSFLRPKTDLNKEAMLGARTVAELLDGVTVPRGPEEFAVEPLASQIRSETP